MAAFLNHLDQKARADAAARNAERVQAGRPPDLTHLGQTAASSVRKLSRFGSAVCRGPFWEVFRFTDCLSAER